tara:strand:+ start:6763 stop:7953 length:1191 start_codon:yes stop_codon:yes gene_type:complete
MPDNIPSNSTNSGNRKNSTILVSLNIGDNKYSEDLEELKQLAISDKLTILAEVKSKNHKPNPATYASKGKVNEIAETLRRTGAQLVIFNNELSPTQQRNLGMYLNCRVIDRTSLILDIFAQRAKSHEGKLQVELAQLQYLSTHLVRGWTHLERQKGGIGLRGPGETQLETDRRLLGKRVKLLKEKLIKLQSRRNIQRRTRKRAQVISVSIIGYTNVGKSTLFNCLTRKKTYAANKLFATLDATTRKLYIPEYGPLVISDTVGFIRELPHTLIAAFKATLEETVQSNILLHVVDASSTNRDEQIEEVNKVLQEIGADTVPQILILNKIDLADSSIGTSGYRRNKYGRIELIRLSAKTGEGINFIKLALTEAIKQDTPQWCKILPQIKTLGDKRTITN